MMQYNDRHIKHLLQSMLYSLLLLYMTAHHMLIVSTSAWLDTCFCYECFIASCYFSFSFQVYEISWVEKWESYKIRCWTNWRVQLGRGYGILAPMHLLPFCWWVVQYDCFHWSTNKAMSDICCSHRIFTYIPIFLELYWKSLMLFLHLHCPGIQRYHVAPESLLIS